LTGRTIDLREAKTYEFDHRVPYAKNGESTIDNLGIVCKQANRMKHDMTVAELVGMCKEILEHQGYDVRPK
jgi:5-methylcytosine-specific restriction endonuclease McrA